MIIVFHSASSGRTGQNTDKRHPLSSAAPQPRFTFTHGLALGSLVLAHTDAHLNSCVQARRRGLTATLVGFSVAGLPHVAAGAARGVGARRPLAGAVLRDVVALANALQCVQLAHAQKHGPRGRNGSGAQIQRRSALERHFANTISPGRLLPRFALHHWVDLLFCHCDASDVGRVR